MCIRDSYIPVPVYNFVGVFVVVYYVVLFYVVYIYISASIPDMGEYKIYRKPTTTDMVIHNTSNHPKMCIRDSLYNTIAK